jgi:hypothetical protein
MRIVSNSFLLWQSRPVFDDVHIFFQLPMLILVSLGVRIPHLSTVRMRMISAHMCRASLSRRTGRMVGPAGAKLHVANRQVSISNKMERFMLASTCKVKALMQSDGCSNHVQSCDFRQGAARSFIGYNLCFAYR